MHFCFCFFKPSGSAAFVFVFVFARNGDKSIVGTESIDMAFVFVFVFSVVQCGATAKWSRVYKIYVESGLWMMDDG